MKRGVAGVWKGTTLSNLSHQRKQNSMCPQPYSVLFLFSMSRLPRGETVDAVLNRQEKKDIMSTKKEMVPPF